MLKLKEIKIIKDNLKKPNKALIDKKIENISGIYFLFNGDLELLYIGQTIYLRKRLLTHLSPRNNGRIKKGDLNVDLMGINSIIPIEEKIKYYSFLPMKDMKKKKLQEVLLIMLLNPKYNYN